MQGCSFSKLDFNFKVGNSFFFFWIEDLEDLK